MKRGLIVLNGDPPGKRLLKSLAQQADTIVAADGGANTLVRAGIPFCAVIGDLDSVDHDAIDKRPTVEVVELHGQNDSDFEKTLGWLLRNTDARDLIFTGGMSAELDHTFTHFSVAAKFAGKAQIRQVEDNALVYYITHHLDLTLRPGALVSLIGLSRAEGVHTSGLKWQLNGDTLALGFRDGLHNVAVSEHVSISLRDGRLAVILQKARGDAFRW